MLNKKCKHKWDFLKDANFNPISQNEHPAKFHCSICNTILTASDVFQLETLNYISGKQKWFSIFALLISFISLFITIISFLY